MKLLIDSVSHRPEPTVTLSLEYDRGDVCLIAKGDEGSIWCLLTFKPNGAVWSYEAIDPSLGFELTKTGKLDIK